MYMASKITQFQIYDLEKWRDPFIGAENELSNICDYLSHIKYYSEIGLCWIPWKWIGTLKFSKGK